MKDCPVTGVPVAVVARADLPAAAANAARASACAYAADAVIFTSVPPVADVPTVEPAVTAEVLICARPLTVAQKNCPDEIDTVALSFAPSITCETAEVETTVAWRSAAVAKDTSAVTQSPTAMVPLARQYLMRFPVKPLRGSSTSVQTGNRATAST